MQSKQDAHIGSEAFAIWVDNLDCSTKESFCAFASDNYSVIEIYIYSRFLGYDGTITDCEAWVKQNYDKPDHLKKILYEIEEMQEDMRKLRRDIEDGLVKRDVGVARIASMQKELRGAISQVSSYTNNKDRKGLLMAGADRAMRELLFVFKDDPLEGPLEEASLSVWSRMQMEE
jgi:NTP pyrophosphatase (non-canonical NTP hydrolase)